MLNIIKDFIPAGRKNRPGKANPRTYITIHNTGNSSKGANAKSHASYIKSDSAANAYVSWHYTVDDSCIYQHIPDNETAYHAGDGSGTGNSQSIGIEICMNSDGDLLKATDNAAELVAALCKAYGISLKNVVQHYNWSRKDCPQLLRSGKPYSWDVFIEKVSGILCPPVTAPKTAEAEVSSVKIELFGERVVEIPGWLSGGTNYVALRALLEAMGYSVDWDGVKVIVRR